MNPYQISYSDLSLCCANLYTKLNTVNTLPHCPWIGKQQYIWLYIETRFSPKATFAFAGPKQMVQHVNIDNRPHKGVGHYPNKNNDKQRKGNCHNYGKPGHWAKECRAP